MRLAVSMWSYVRPFQEGRLDIPAFVREAARAGAEGVELLDFFYRDREPEAAATQAALADTGLPVPIFSVANNFAKPSAEARDTELAKIRFGIEEARRYGAQVIRVFAGDVSPGITFEDARAWIVEGLAEASKVAHDKGLSLALENHGTLAGRGEQVRALIEDVRHLAANDALGANPDTGNFLLVDQPSHEAVREVAPLAKMVHFKDFAPAKEGQASPYRSLSGTPFVGTAIGEGAVDLASCLEALREAAFDGWLSVEYEGDEDPFTAIPRSLQTARRFL